MNHSASALNVVVEAAVFVTVAFEQFETVLVAKVLELHEHVRPALRHLLHEYIEEFDVFVEAQAWMLVANVELIGEQCFVVGPHVDSDR